MRWRDRSSIRPGSASGTYARADGVHLRIGAKASTREEAQALIAPVERELEAIFGNSIWGRDEDTLEGFIARTLCERSQSVGTMESATGGLLASTLSDAPDAGGSFAGGIVAAGSTEEFATVSGGDGGGDGLGSARAAGERLRGRDHGRART